MSSPQSDCEMQNKTIVRCFANPLDQFPVAALTNGLQQRGYCLPVPEHRSPKSRCCQGCTPSAGCRGGSSRAPVASVAAGTPQLLPHRSQLCLCPHMAFAVCVESPSASLLLGHTSSKTRKVSRHCQVSPGQRHRPRLRATALDDSFKKLDRKSVV